MQHIHEESCCHIESLLWLVILGRDAARVLRATTTLGCSCRSMLPSRIVLRQPTRYANETYIHTTRHHATPPWHTLHTLKNKSADFARGLWALPPNLKLCYRALVGWAVHLYSSRQSWCHRKPLCSPVIPGALAARKPALHLETPRVSYESNISICRSMLPNCLLFFGAAYNTRT